jgi:two-component system nitrogen regulation sensor histidine kinase NtrY
VAVSGAGLAATEWLRDPAPLLVLATWVGGLTAVAALAPLAGWRRRILALTLLGLGVALLIAQRQLTEIETRWPQVRSTRVDAAFTRLQGDLHAALDDVRRLAGAAAGVSGRSAADRAAAFRRLAGLVPTSGPEVGVAIFDPGDAPFAWAGRHRLPPRAGGDSVAARATGYYVTLEARRHSPDGRVAVASMLLWAHDAVPDRSRSLAELFRRRNDVSLAVYPGGLAPDSVDVFDYVEPTTAGPRLLFSVQPVPLPQGAAKELAFARGSRAVVWLLLLVLVVSLSLARRPVEWYALVPFSLWLVVRAPIGPALGLDPVFSPATFFRPLLGPLSSSAGALALAGTLLTMLGVWLWRRRVGRTWYGVLLGGGLLYIAPYLIRSLGRGITPPAGGASIGLWLTWQLALTVSVAALVVPAAALFRGDRPATPSSRWSVAGAVIALAAAVIGVLVWSPRGAWPDWYPFLWTVALLLVALPAPRWAAIGGIALAAGSSAALVTWGAELSGKLQVAQRDIARLGGTPDPLAASLLARFGEGVREASPPGDASAMYALWNRSALRQQGYPAHLALWSGTGELHDELMLDSLDLPPSLLSTMVRELPAEVDHRIVPLVRVPGVHHVLLARVGPEVISVSVGPRSALVAPGRVGRLLDPYRRRAPFYRLALTPPMVKSSEVQRLRWRREGWVLRAEHSLELPGGTRTVHAAVDLRGPLPLFIRASLVVLLDAIVLALLWFGAEHVAGGRLARPRWGRLARSFRIRLAATLAAFFIMPAIGFTAWGLARLEDEGERSRDLLISQTLREAAAASGGALRAAGPSRAERLRELSRRIDADLALYEGGRLAATSVEVLQDLGVVGQLLDPAAFELLALRGELEATLDGTIPRIAERIGYRVVEPGPPREVAVLATPQLADDPSRGLRELDLALGLLLMTVLGAAAALVGARVASRTLSRPVAELRRLALALGKGDAMPRYAERPPAEFEPVFAAFERMAADIQASHRAQRVLAWGEMARQVAHEIKNPLTPLRLGVQHLRRVHRDRRPDFDQVLEETAERILGEIDRLDTIARAFSRFGAPADDRQPVDILDLAAVVGDVVQLYRLAEDEECEVRLVSLPEARGAARSDEVKEVIVNLLENARNAGARTVTITVSPDAIAVADDGRGIPPELLPRIFEPQFSTTTSGSGLGLAIVRRLVESWGGRIEVESEVGRGTTVTVRLAA